MIDANRLRKELRAWNRAPARFRLLRNLRYGQQKVAGGVNRDPFVLVGTDVTGRFDKIKGTAEFIFKTLTEGGYEKNQS